MVKIDELKNFSEAINGKLLFNYNLKKTNWFNIGGTAKVFFKPDSFNSSSILNGPLFLKKGLCINKFNIKTYINYLSRFIANYFLSTIVADHCASAIFFPSTKA